MAKKNTLQDLNAFLKHQQQEVPSASNEQEFLKSKGTVLAKVEKKSQWQDTKLKAAAAQLASQLQAIAEAQKLSGYQVLLAASIQFLEEKEDLKAAEVMLLNTLLYLQHNER